LAKLDFTSERKRMSVIVKHPQTNKILIFCKGADSVILPKVTSKNTAAELAKAKEHLKNFSKKGLRTLCVAKNELEEYVFNEWFGKYQEVLKKKNSPKNAEEEKKIEAELMKVFLFNREDFRNFYRLKMKLKERCAYWE